MLTLSQIFIIFLKQFIFLYKKETNLKINLIKRFCISPHFGSIIHNGLSMSLWPVWNPFYQEKSRYYHLVNTYIIYQNQICGSEMCVFQLEYHQALYALSNWRYVWFFLFFNAVLFPFKSEFVVIFIAFYI